MKKLSVRFRVRMDGWVTRTRLVPDDFDLSKRDESASPESLALDILAYEAFEAAHDELEPEIDDMEILPLEALP